MNYKKILVCVITMLFAGTPGASAMHQDPVKLCELVTEDGHVLRIPKEIAFSCPYLEARFSVSLYKEANNRRATVPKEYSWQTVVLVKQLLALRYEHTTIKKESSEQLRIAINAHLDNQENISTDAILLADHWLMPDIAHALTQYLLTHADTLTHANDIIAALPSSCRPYIPPFLHDNNACLEGQELTYINLLAQAARRGFINNEEEVAQKAITLMAQKFDRYLASGTALEDTMCKPNMLIFAELLKKELIQKKLIKDHAIGSSVDSSAIKTLVDLGNNRLLATTKGRSTAYIVDTLTGRTCSTVGGFFENTVAANKYDDKHIVTASYKKSDQVSRFLARNNIYGSILDKEVVYLRLNIWNISGDEPVCVATHTEGLFVDAEYSTVKYLNRLDDERVLVHAGDNMLLLWNSKTNAVQRINLGAITGRAWGTKRVIVLDANRVAVLYKDLWDAENGRFTEAFGILDISARTFTRSPEYYDLNAMKSMATLAQFDADNVVVCAHENWYAGDSGQAHFATAKLVEVATGNVRIISQSEFNPDIRAKKHSFSAVKIDDKKMILAGARSLILNRETDTPLQCLVQERGNPSRCAAVLKDGRVAFGMNNGDVNIITPNSLLTLQEIINRHQQRLRQ